MSKPDKYPWDFSPTDLYRSPYPGTAVGHECTERNPLFSETFEQGEENLEDKVIQIAVTEALRLSPEVDTSDILIGVEEGVVTLQGNVLDRSMSTEAEIIAENVPGVKNVMNYLQLLKII